MKTTIKGSCHCGAVKLEVPEDAVGVVACHCGDCQKLHGNFFAMLAVDRAEVSIADASSVRWYDSSEKVRRSFCANCGSRLMKDPLGGPKLLVSVGLFAKELPRRIVKQVFVESKPAWYDLPSETKA